VQHLRGEGLCGGSEVKAFARGIVVGGNGLAEVLGWELFEVGFARDEASQAADGALDAALLPRRVRIAEEGLHQEALQGKVSGELGAVVEGDGAAQCLWYDFEQAHEMAGDADSKLAFDGDGEQQARSALVDGQDGLPVFGEHHQVGFPVAGDFAIGDLGRAFCQRNTAFNEACGASASFTAVTSLALAAGQIAPPVEVGGARDLGVDEAVDALVGDHLATTFTGKPARDLFGRPAAAQARQNLAAQAGISLKARAFPAPRPCLLLGIARLVADLPATVPPQLPRDR